MVTGAILVANDGLLFPTPDPEHYEWTGYWGKTQQSSHKELQ